MTKKILALLLIAFVGVSIGAVASSSSTIKWNTGALFTRNATMSGYKDTSDVFTFPLLGGETEVTFAYRTAGFDAADDDTCWLLLYGIHLDPLTVRYEFLDTLRVGAYADGADDSSVILRTYQDTFWNYYYYSYEVRWDTSGTATDTMRPIFKIGGQGWATQFRGFALIASTLGDTLDDSIYVYYRYQVRNLDDRTRYPYSY